MPAANRTVYRDIDYQFSANPMTGDVSVKTNEQAIRQQVLTTIGTQTFERPFNPSFGSNIRQYLFEPIHAITAELIRSEIYQVVTTHVPQARIQKVTIVPNAAQNRYDITVELQPKNLQVFTIDTLLERIR